MRSAASITVSGTSVMAYGRKIRTSPDNPNV